MTVCDLCNRDRDCTALRLQHVELDICAECVAAKPVAEVIRVAGVRDHAMTGWAATGWVKVGASECAVIRGGG